jgi:hypothetical protein
MSNAVKQLLLFSGNSRAEQWTKSTKKNLFVSCLDVVLKHHFPAHLSMSCISMLLWHSARLFLALESHICKEMFGSEVLCSLYVCLSVPCA